MGVIHRLAGNRSSPDSESHHQHRDRRNFRMPVPEKKEREERMRPDTAHFRTNAYPSHASLHAIASGEQMH